MEVGDILYSLFSLINPSAFGQQTAELVTYGVGACPREPPDFLISQAEAVAQGEKLPLLCRQFFENTANTEGGRALQ